MTVTKKKKQTKLKRFDLLNLKRLFVFFGEMRLEMGGEGARRGVSVKWGRWLEGIYNMTTNELLLFTFLMPDTYLCTCSLVTYQQSDMCIG